MQKEVAKLITDDRRLFILSAICQNKTLMWKISDYLYIRKIGGCQLGVLISWKQNKQHISELFAARIS